MKKKTIFIIAGCVTLTLIVVLIMAILTPSAQSYYEKGRRALLTGNYEEAQELLTKAIEKSEDTSLTLKSDALMSLAECSSRQGDSVKAIDYTRQAALLFNQQAQAVYGDYLDRHKELKEEFISYYSYLNKQSPQESRYAGKLAGKYLFDVEYGRNYDKAGELLLPFISKSGSGSGDPNTVAYAAYLMALGEGGYPESPEAAMMLGGKCIGNVKSIIEDPTIDAEALLILGNLALAECASDTRSDMYDNVVKAGILYEAAEKADIDGSLGGMPRQFINRIDDFCAERQKVAVDPNWWDKNPNDWTRFYNHETGFRYLGHTNYSGYQGAFGGSEYPTGWGIGAWTKDCQVFLGKWNAGKYDIANGILIYCACLNSYIPQ